ncbi:MAG: type III-B CRISPR-associated protein Cas10/Cmr2, partial [Candidatus Competibacter sp.]|nr:type III-B CRISPR-associated protein Cas10/Cmr2 [Candidatus Competibacter sp.]
MSTTTPTYLIKLGLASVQRFIGAARRSRDLSSGSWLVAEVVKAAARYLHERPTVALIFPAPDNPPGSDFQPSNVVLAQVQTEDPA